MAQNRNCLLVSKLIINIIFVVVLIYTYLVFNCITRKNTQKGGRHPFKYFPLITRGKWAIQNEKNMLCSNMSNAYINIKFIHKEPYIPFYSENCSKAVSQAFITVWISCTSLNLEPRNKKKKIKQTKIIQVKDFAKWLSSFFKVLGNLAFSG